MEKKEYKMPQVEAVELKAQTPLAGSANAGVTFEGWEDEEN